MMTTSSLVAINTTSLLPQPAIEREEEEAALATTNVLTTDNNIPQSEGNQLNPTNEHFFAKSTARVSATKIPTPLAIYFTNKINNVNNKRWKQCKATTAYQFQRSISLRLRSTKSKSNSIYTDTRKHNTSNNTRADTEQQQQHRQQTIQNNTHEFVSTTGGRFSPRRKLVLTSSTTLPPVQGLARTLTLRSKLKRAGYKTDCAKAKNLTAKTAVAAATLKDLQLTNGANEYKVAVDDDAKAIAECCVNSVSVRDKEHTTTTMEELNAKTVCNNVSSNSSKDSPNMSESCNGTNSIATPIITPTTTAQTRPSTLATAVLSNDKPLSPVITKSNTATTPKTPKTPTSAARNIPQTHPKQSHHHYQQQQQQHHHACCTKQQLPSVPEAKLTPKTPPVTPDSPCTYLDDDLDSMYSFATTTSGRSTMSCEHPYVARNGTTFSGRKMKYVVHCSNYAGQVGADYLTPTQRAQRQIRRLKELLCIARQDLEQKDSEIMRLTREVVELRLFKASLSSPEERSASSDAVTVREAELKTSQDVSPIVDMVDDVSKSSPRRVAGTSRHQQHNQQQQQQLLTDMQSSFADSGHFEDMTTSSVHSKDSYVAHTHDIACGSDEIATAGAASCNADSYELQRQQLIEMYEQRIEELIRNQDTATSEIKRSHNDKVEALLQKLAECNTRYADIVPDYEHAKERIRELEKQLEDLQRKLVEHEEKQNKMYLHMYQQGQEAERLARADQALELAYRAPSNKVSINELLQQLQSTQDELENIRAAECRNECGNHALLTAKEAISLWVLGARKTIYRRLLEAQKNRTHVDPEVTLQFLKSAIYYFLTDKENSQGHLQAIESILEFTEAEKENISKVRAAK